MPVQDYTAMTRFFVALVVLLAVLAAVLAIGFVFLRTSKKIWAVRNIARRQNDLLNQIMIELRSAPNLYGGFPQNLDAALYRIHQDYNSDILGKGQDEIED